MTISPVRICKTGITLVLVKIKINWLRILRKSFSRLPSCGIVNSSNVLKASITKFFFRFYKINISNTSNSSNNNDNIKIESSNERNESNESNERNERNEERECQKLSPIIASIASITSISVGILCYRFFKGKYFTRL